MNKLFASIRSNIIGTHIVTKILEDRKINVTSWVKNAPPPGIHVFKPIVTIFELIQDIIETYILAKFYEDWNINVASSILELSYGNHLVDGHTDRHSIKLLQPKHLCTLTSRRRPIGLD
ncbi:hypothetical protein DPMN_049207 [Dreissena polymorpha]|uniref:Uncharacterized protein n=1 Tax=Dreissena polymorpha TaxID=45954 RepID=A0A9D4CEY4_DREPO|nr:hypothetical protein DPMN_049207 [Dreissena polymorpha]